MENKGFREFVDNTPNAYLGVFNVKNELIKKGYKELKEFNNWDNVYGKHFVIRNDSSIIAFNIPQYYKEAFNITISHIDSPSYSIKPNADIFKEGYLKLNTEPYGGMINYSWLDRPLSLAGRVILEKDNNFISKIVNIDRNLLVIPSQAIHINREVNEKNNLNQQVDMLPIISLNSDDNLDDILKKELQIDNIIDYDLYLYNRDKTQCCGYNNEFIMGPRLDDLACVYPSLMSFIDSTNEDSINIFCAFNNEEIGSLKYQAADSTFLKDIIDRISTVLNINLYKALSNTIMVSADNAHATHPNASNKKDPTNDVKLNNGIVIKRHTNYTTDGISSAVFKKACNSQTQDFACKSDMKCGSTLGGISISHVSIAAVDIGIPMLAMHSANELIGSKDVLTMYQGLLNYYNCYFNKTDEGYKVYTKNRH